MPRTKPPAMCRYCTAQPIKGFVKCQRCEGYRNPNRRHARRSHKNATPERGK